MCYNLCIRDKILAGKYHRKSTKHEKYKKHITYRYRYINIYLERKEKEVKKQTKQNKKEKRNKNLIYY